MEGFLSFVLGCLIGIIITSLIISKPLAPLKTEIGTLTKYGYGSIATKEWNRPYLTTMYEYDLEKARLELRKSNARRFADDREQEPLVEIYYREIQ